MQIWWEPQASIPDHLWSLGEKQRWRRKVWASLALPGMGLDIRKGCFLEKEGLRVWRRMPLGARRQCWEGEGGCGHHPYMSAAAASFCSSLNPIFLTASAWGSWDWPLPRHPGTDRQEGQVHGRGEGFSTNQGV